MNLAPWRQIGSQTSAHGITRSRDDICGTEMGSPPSDYSLENTATGRSSCPPIAIEDPCKPEPNAGSPFGQLNQRALHFGRRRF